MHDRVVEGPRLWLEDDAVRRGPYCAQCYRERRVLVRLDGADLTRCRMCNVLAPSPADPLV
jgi:hypothetical protein